MRAALVALSMTFAVMPFGCGGGASKPEEKRLTKEDYEKALRGKTVDEVKAILGAPRGTEGNPDTDPGETKFSYHEQVYNPHTGRYDTLYVYFVHRKVSRVRQP